MARSKRTSMYVDGHSYSLFDPEEIHRDLRTDPARARTVIARSKQIQAAHEFCQECRDIERAQAADQIHSEATSYPSLDAAIVAHAQRETKLAITRANLARMLGLPAGERITRMYVSDDPQLLFVIVAGEHYQPVPDGTEVPVSKSSRTQTTPR